MSCSYPRVLTPVLLLCFFVPFVFADGDKSLSKQIKKLGKKLDRCLVADDEYKAREVLGELAEIDHPDAVEWIVRTAAAETSVEMFDHTFEMLGTMPPEKLNPCFERLINAKNPKSLMLAVVVMVAERVEGEIAEGWMIQALACPDDMARRNAILALDKRRSKKAIPVLIDLLDKKTSKHGTIEYMARVALISLTGHDFELVADWRKFWETHGEELDPKNLESDSSTGVALKKADQDAPEFFGVKLVSRKVIFVIDVSGSMALWDDDGKSDWQSRQRIWRVKKELAGAVQRMKKNGYFNILAFSHQLQPFRKQMVKSSGGNKGSALGWIRKLLAKGGTFTDDAMRAALSDRNVDTVVLLSDGSPARGQNDGPDVMIPRIIEEVRKLNRLKKIRIYTFGFEGKGQFPPGDPRKLVHEHQPEKMIEFLKTLAEENGGKYTTVE